MPRVDPADALLHLHPLEIVLELRAHLRVALIPLNLTARRLVAAADGAGDEQRLLVGVQLRQDLGVHILRGDHLLRAALACLETVVNVDRNQVEILGHLRDVVVRALVGVQDGGRPEHPTQRRGDRRERRLPACDVVAADLVPEENATQRFARPEVGQDVVDDRRSACSATRAPGRRHARRCLADRRTTKECRAFARCRVFVASAPSRWMFTIPTCLLGSGSMP